MCVCVWVFKKRNKKKRKNLSKVWRMWDVRRWGGWCEAHEVMILVKQPSAWRNIMRRRGGESLVREGSCFLVRGKRSKNDGKNLTTEINGRRRNKDTTACTNFLYPETSTLSWERSCGSWRICFITIETILKSWSPETTSVTYSDSKNNILLNIATWIP